ncbi:MAG: amidase [Gammaproteobacteria bacterium]|nr:amidase [Gammaproteobacteria bacterium]
MKSSLNLVLLISILTFVSGCEMIAHKQTQHEQFTLLEATIEEIQSAYDAGTLTSVGLVEKYLDRINEYDQTGPAINSIITVHPDALQIAEQLDNERDAGRYRGPLHGIPVLLKDNIDTYDLPTSNGSAILKDIIPPDDATLTRELREAGAIILGKAAMGEFASGSYNSVIGQQINPYHFKRDTGGSSSGSASAIASNFAVLAVGTDTSTSVRGPAAFNGIVGLRPTTGLISRDGIAPKDLEFDSAGPMARTVTDVAYMLSSIAVEDLADPASGPVWTEVRNRYDVVDGHVDYTNYLDNQAIQGKRIGVVRTLFGGDAEIDAMAKEALKVIESLGGILVDVELSDDFITRYLGEGSRYIRRTADYRFRRDWEAYLATLPGAPGTVAEFIDIYENVVNKSSLPARENVLRLLRTSLQHSTEEEAYQNLVSEILPNATADKLEIFNSKNLDVLVFPYETRFAGVISNPVYSLEDPDFVDSDVPVPSTLAGYNSIGFPCIVVPMGHGSQGLPMALAFFGKPYDDGPIIGYAYAYEQASKKRRAPPLLPAVIK